MGAQLRVYRGRIKSVKATKKITKAMELIASSRIVKAQQRVDASLPYTKALVAAVTAALAGTSGFANAVAPTITSVLVTSNASGTPTGIGINGTGLCVPASGTSCTSTDRKSTRLNSSHT